MHFAEPSWLWAGAASVVGLCLLILWSERRRARALARFVAARHLAALTDSVSAPLRWTKHGLSVLSVACLFAALARPQWGYHFEADKREGVDLLFAVDTSKSMLAQDLRPSRLVRAKLAVEELVDKLPGARVGLVAFAGDAFLQTPLTADRVAFQKSLDALDSAVIPVPGTSLQSAIRVAQQAFRSEPEQRKVLVLLTDGEDLSDSLGHASRAAAESGIVVHAIGIGTSAGAPIPLPGVRGGDALLRDPNGQLVHSRLDEAALRELTNATGGSYHVLGASGQGALQLYRDALSRLPKQLHEVNLRKVFYERFQWPLGLGMGLLLLSLLLNDQRARPPARRAAVALTTLLGSALAASSPASTQAQDRPAVTTYNGATSSYRSGDFDAATDGYRDALETTDLALQQRAYYDLGNSLYRQGQATEQQNVAQTMERYKQAIGAYESALALDADDQDATYNRDFVRAKLQELEREQAQQARSGEQGAQSNSDKSHDQAGQQPSGGRSQQGAADGGGRDQRSGQGQQQPQGAQAQRAETDPKDGAGDAGGPDRQSQAARADQRSRDEENNPGSQPQLHADQRQQAPEQQGQRAQSSAAGAEQPAPDATQANAEGARGSASKTDKQPGAAAVPGGLNQEQAARLLDALEGELEQLPSGYAAVRSPQQQQDEQARKDW